MQVQSLSWEDLWRRRQQPIPIFLPGKSQGQTNLADYSPWSPKRVGQDLVTNKKVSQELVKIKRVIKKISFEEMI